MNETDPLAQLKDIHMPDPLALWVPAPGWWILAFVLLIIVFYSVRLLQKKIRRNRYRKLALLELQTTAIIENPTELLSALNKLLKRVAISAFGADNCASLKGHEWLAFLDRTLAQKKPVFSTGAGQILCDGQYRPNNQFNRDELLSITQLWIKNHTRLPLKKKGDTNV